jgi:hypothetical protein
MTYYIYIHTIYIYTMHIHYVYTPCHVNIYIHMLYTWAVLRNPREYCPVTLLKISVYAQAFSLQTLSYIL